MTDVAEVAVYGIGFVLVALGVLAAGVAIAQFVGANGPDEPCPDWVLVEVDPTEGFQHSYAWGPCPHRLPCPIHKPSRRFRRG